MTFPCIECRNKLDEKTLYRKLKNRCKDCLNKKLKSELCGVFFTKKWFNSHIEREHKLTETQLNFDSVNTNNNNRTFTIGVSNCCETYLLKCILLQKQEPIFKITKSLYHYPNIIAQTSDELQSLKNYENSTVVFDDMLLSKQGSNIDLLLTRGRHKNIDFHYMS